MIRAVLLLTVVCACHAATFEFGGLFPATGGLASGGVQREAAARIAIEHINADNSILDGHTLETDNRDTGTRPSLGVQRALELNGVFGDRNSGVVAFIGAASSGVSAATSQVNAVFQKPQISYSSTSPSLSDKASYPYFCRVVPPDSKQALGLAKIFTQQGWQKVAILATSDAYGQGMISFFLSYAQDEGIQVLTNQQFVPGADKEEIRSKLQLLKNSGANVFILNAVIGESRNVIREIRDMGMWGRDYVWIGSDGVMQSSVYADITDEADREAVKANTAGFIGLLPYRGTGSPKYEAFIDVWETKDPSQYAGAGSRDINAYAPFAYDAVYVYAYAIDKMLNDGEDPNDGSKLLEYVKATDFLGITGPLTFTEDCDRAAVYSLTNHQDGNFVSVGLWTEASGTYVLDQGKQIVYAEGRTDTPPDVAPCKPGYFLQNGLCTQCVPGTFKDVVGNTACTNCAAGYFQDEYGATACKPCAQGTYRPENFARDKCETCPPGEFQTDEGQDSCTVCPQGSSNFLPLLLQKVAREDATITTALDAFDATSDAMCTCIPGFYGESGAQGCTVCPEGGSCCVRDADGVSPSECISGSVKPVPLPGFFASTDDSSIMVSCHLPQACAGGEGSQCGDGYGGNRCGACADEGFYRLGKQCLACPESASLLLVLVIILLIVLVAIVLYISAIGIRLSSMIIFTNVVQVTALYVYYELKWPTLLIDLMNTASFLNFNLELFAPECYFGSGTDSYYSKWSVWLLLPIFFGLLLAVVYGMFSAIGKQMTQLTPGERPSPWRSLFVAEHRERVNKFINAFVMFLGVAYTLLCAKSLELFICKPKEDGTAALVAAPHLDCYTSDYNAMVPVAVIAMIVYGIGLPVALAVLLRRNRHRLNDPDFRMRFGSVFKGYKEDWYMWDVAAMLRKFGILFGTVVFNRTTMYQTLFGLLVLFAYLLLEVHARPFKIKAVNRVQVVADITLFITLLSGVFFDSGKLNEGWEGATDFITYFLIVIIIFAFAVALGTVVLEARIHWRALKYSTNTLEGSNTAKEITKA